MSWWTPGEWLLAIVLAALIVVLAANLVLAVM